MKNTGFIVSFEHFTNGSRGMQKTAIKVHTMLQLEDEQACDDYVIGNDINVQCMERFGWTAIEDWNVNSMFRHNEPEMSFEPYVKQHPSIEQQKIGRGLRTSDYDGRIQYAPFILEELPPVVVDNVQLTSKTVKTAFESAFPIYDRDVAAMITATGREAVKSIQNQSLVSSINYQLTTSTPLNFLKSIFGSGVNYKASLNWNGIEHMYISSGSTRDVYVDPTWSYVIKKNHDNLTSITGNQFNAVEVWDYWNTKEDDDLPKVPTKLINNEKGNILIQQDFLIVLNTSRGRINKIFEDSFIPEDNHVTDVYGYQYGWNRKTKRIELYDTSDAYIGRGHIDNAFESSYSLFDEEFKDFECFAKIHFYEEFVKRAKISNIWQSLLKIDKRLSCQLLHQDGLIFNHNDKTITICGTIFDEYKEQLTVVIDKFISNYKPDTEYFKATISNLEINSTQAKLT